MRTISKLWITYLEAERLRRQSWFLKGNLLSRIVIDYVRPQAMTERQMIRQFCEERKIVMLLHFTRLENLAGIVREGLIARKELGTRPTVSRPICCDRYRARWYSRANCLSISFPNDLMFCRYRRQSPESKWAVLKIKPSVLWELDCAFCRKNAWSNDMRRTGMRDLQSLKSYDSFVHMFGTFGRKPLNRQAEVLVFNRLEPEEHFDWVYFCSAADRDDWKSNDGRGLTIGSSIDPKFFRFRN